jgi:RimJ/RimL family protein N-acetyltransferase
MGYINSYKLAVQAELHGYYGPDPYDINWAFPLHENTLKSERMILTPFRPSIHIDELWKQVETHPALQHWLPFEIATKDRLLATIETRLRRDPGAILFAIMAHHHANPTGGRGGGSSSSSSSSAGIPPLRPDADAGQAHRPSKASPEPTTAMAGVIALIKASPANLSAEIGWVIVFPAFQRTHVASNAVALLLRYCLELPSDSDSDSDSGSTNANANNAAPAPMTGLGLRRVQWFAHAENEASRRTALRVGFREEGTLRWERVIAPGKVGNGIPVRDGDPLGGASPSRHSVVLSLCVDDWEDGGVRELVGQLIG